MRALCVLVAVLAFAGTAQARMVRPGGAVRMGDLARARQLADGTFEGSNTGQVQDAGDDFFADQQQQQQQAEPQLAVPAEQTATESQVANETAPLCTTVQIFNETTQQNTTTLLCEGNNTAPATAQVPEGIPNAEGNGPTQQLSEQQDTQPNAAELAPQANPQTEQPPAVQSEQATAPQLEQISPTQPVQQQATPTQYDALVPKPTTPQLWQPPFVPASTVLDHAFATQRQIADNSYLNNFPKYRDAFYVGNGRMTLEQMRAKASTWLGNSEIEQHNLHQTDAGAGLGAGGNPSESSKSISGSSDSSSGSSSDSSGSSSDSSTSSSSSFESSGDSSNSSSGNSSSSCSSSDSSDSSDSLGSAASVMPSSSSSAGVSMVVPPIINMALDTHG